MKNEIVLQAEKRERSTKGTVNAMRRQGRVPGVAYGDKEPPLALSVDEKSLRKAMQSPQGRNALISLEIDKTTHPVLLKEIQHHPITRAIRHVDFYRVSLKKKIEASVPLHIKGEAPGVKMGGGVLEHVIRQVRVRCLPTEIPTAMDIDVSSLQIGQNIKGKDLHAPADVELLLDPELVIVNVVSPTILEETTPAAGTAEATAAEPEVIKKGKVEEGEEGAAPAAGGEKKAAAAPAAAKPEAKKAEGK